MPKLLTKTLLRKAAALLSPGDIPEDWTERHADHQYMCYAVLAAAGLSTTRVDHAVYVDFTGLLRDHEVGSDGRLCHPSNAFRGVPQPTSLRGTTESQALRFTFLLLLAESL